jgi:hypothetical protein
MPKTKRQQQHALLVEIIEVKGITGCSYHQSQRPVDPHLEMLGIWPKELKALLQTAGKMPKTQLLALQLTHAHLLCHLRPPKPLGRAWEQPGHSWETRMEVVRREGGERNEP